MSAVSTTYILEDIPQQAAPSYAPNPPSRPLDINLKKTPQDQNIFQPASKPPNFYIQCGFPFDQRKQSSKGTPSRSPIPLATSNQSKRPDSFSTAIQNTRTNNTPIHTKNQENRTYLPTTPNSMLDKSINSSPHTIKTKVVISKIQQIHKLYSAGKSQWFSTLGFKSNHRTLFQQSNCNKGSNSNKQDRSSSYGNYLDNSCKNQAHSEEHDLQEYPYQGENSELFAQQHAYGLIQLPIQKKRSVSQKQGKKESDKDQLSQYALLPYSRKAIITSNPSIRCFSQLESSLKQGSSSVSRERPKNITSGFLDSNSNIVEGHKKSRNPPPPPRKRDSFNNLNTIVSYKQNSLLNHEKMVNESDSISASRTETTGKKILFVRNSNNTISIGESSCKMKSQETQPRGFQVMHYDVQHPTDNSINSQVDGGNSYLPTADSRSISKGRFSLPNAFTAKPLNPILAPFQVSKPVFQATATEFNRQTRISNSTHNNNSSSDQNVKKNQISMENFQITRELGKGSYAVVKHGVDKRNQQQVAIKIYEKFKLSDPNKFKNIRREINILSKMNNPKIIRLIHVIDTVSSLNLIMEYFGSNSLYSFLKTKTKSQLSMNSVRKIFTQIIEGLAYMHEKNVCHRDIKLENILLDEQLNVKIIDFGFALCSPVERKIDNFCGTPSYMSPEIVLRKEYCGQSSDIWAAGVVLFILVCGKFPFKGSDEKELYRKISKHSCEIPSFIESGARNLIQKLLAENPEERPNCPDILKDNWLVSYDKEEELFEQQSLEPITKEIEINGEKNQ